MQLILHTLIVDSWVMGITREALFDWLVKKLRSSRSTTHIANLHIHD